MDLQTVERALTVASLLLTLALLWRIRAQRLHVVYRFLAMYLAWDAIGAVVLFFVPRKETTYFYFYFGFKFVQWILDVLVTLDLVSLITKRYAGITSVARVAVTACLVIAMATAILSALIDLSRAPTEQAPLLNGQLVDRTVQFSVLVFLGLMLIFLLWFPIKLSRNTVAYAAGFIVMFATRFSLLLLGNLLVPNSFQALSDAILAVFILVLIYWTVRITVSNEGTETVVGHAWDRTSERRLVSQLESINQSLLRTRSKTNSS